MKIYTIFCLILFLANAAGSVYQVSELSWPGATFSAFVAIYCLGMAIITELRNQ